MSAPPWMPFYVADYLADTGHLTTCEHGAYLMLICHYWQNGGLPPEPARLARICRMTAKQWSEIEATMADLFGPEWRHKRIDFELANASETMSKRSAAGKAGASARYGKRNANGMAHAEQSHAPIPSPRLEEEERNEEPGQGEATGKRGSRGTSGGGRAH